MGINDVNTVGYSDATEGGAPLAEVPAFVAAPQATNFFLDSFEPATQTISGLGNTGHVCSVQGSGSVTVGSHGTATEGSTVGFLDTGDVLCTVAGSLDWVQIELGDRPTLPIKTTTGAVTRDADLLTLDSANWNNAQGSVYIEVFLNGASAAILGDFLEYDSKGGGYILTDGANSASLSLPTETWQKIGFVYGGGTMRLNVGGTWSAEVPYNGALLAGDLTVITPTSSVDYARNLRIYDAPSEALIESLMI